MGTWIIVMNEINFLLVIFTDDVYELILITGDSAASISTVNWAIFIHIHRFFSFWCQN